jgi:hypothetical protein
LPKLCRSTFTILDVPGQDVAIGKILTAPKSPHGLVHTGAEDQFDVLVCKSATGIPVAVCCGKSLVIRAPGSVSIGRDPAIDVDVAAMVQFYNKLLAARQDGRPSGPRSSPA